MIRNGAERFFTGLMFAASLSAATVDGIRLHLTVSGRGPKTVILVHGWTCDERTWESQLPELSRTYRIITLDLPGHGQSGSPQDGKLSMNLFVRAIEAVRKEQNAERVVLVGHSMGTAAIMQYARIYPKLSSALVLVDGSVSMPPSAPRDRMLSTAKQYGESASTREAMVQTMFTANTSEEVRKKVLSMTLAAPPATPLAAMQAFVDPAIWKEDVFPQPTLVVLGDMIDATDPESDLNYMKARFPNLEYVKMAGAGHFLMLERPAEFNAILKSFLDKQRF